MIKQINVSNMQKFESQLIKAQAEGYTHIVPYANEIMIYQSMLEAVQLHPTSIVVDYTVNGQYKNDCRYFGQKSINFTDWANNSNYYPNMIYAINQTLELVQQYHIETLFDLALVTLISGELSVDGHVVFDFKAPIATSSSIWDVMQTFEDIDMMSQFYLNKIAYINRYAIPFRNVYVEDTEQLNAPDNWLYSTKFLLPKWLYKISKQRFDNKQLHHLGIYTKQPELLKNHIVFIGNDYQYAGNSKYLFNYFVKHNPMTACYFITDDRRGPHFVSPKSEEAVELINNARVILVENDIPDSLQPNGTLIQLHQGMPLIRLFLDSKENTKNLETPYYRANRYNRWLQFDYVIHSADDISHFYETAFPSHQSNVLAYGNAKQQYLSQKRNETTIQQQYKKSFKIDDSKPVLLYAPIGLVSAQQLPLSDALFKAYHVVVQGVDESILPEEVIVAPNYLSVQDLILMSDIIVTDYSNIVFDALTIDKTVALYTPNHSQFIEEQGVNEEIWRHFSKIWYTDRQLLISNLISQAITVVKYPQIQHKEQPFESISQLILSKMKSNQQR
ncbi:CDP-glycerol glycerophosphotransferase family protein [Staphylococcus roterodami]|nr:CDP-glycerol glycerophosphotransferase family protein [Staphylococcus roterodami]